MNSCVAINKKTGKVCGGIVFKVVEGVPLCMKHYTQWSNGKTIQTRRNRTKTRFRRI